MGKPIDPMFFSTFVVPGIDRPISVVVAGFCVGANRMIIVHISPRLANNGEWYNAKDAACIVSYYIDCLPCAKSPLTEKPTY